jgi:MarR family transcriptional regulator, transcriptional regulator for hemolysin
MDEIEGPDRSIGFLISDVARLLRRVYDRRVEHLGLTRSQWRVLVHLYRREGCSQTELATILEIEKPTLGGLIDRLEAKGWVERRVDPGDLRAKRIVLTERVRPVIDDMERLARDVHSEALFGVSAEDSARMSRVLFAMKANLLGVVAEEARAVHTAASVK